MEKTNKTTPLVYAIVDRELSSSGRSSYIASLATAHAVFVIASCGFRKFPTCTFLIAKHISTKNDYDVATFRANQQKCVCASNKDFDDIEIAVFWNGNVIDLFVTRAFRTK